MWECILNFDPLKNINCEKFRVYCFSHRSWAAQDLPDRWRAARSSFCVLQASKQKWSRAFKVLPQNWLLGDILWPDCVNPPQIQAEANAGLNYINKVQNKQAGRQTGHKTGRLRVRVKGAINIGQQVSAGECNEHDDQQMWKKVGQNTDPLWKHF